MKINRPSEWWRRGGEDDLEGAAARLVSIRVNQRSPSTGRPPHRWSVEQLIAALVMRGWHARGPPLFTDPMKYWIRRRIPAEYQWNEEIRRSNSRAPNAAVVRIPSFPLLSAIIPSCSTSFFFPRVRIEGFFFLVNERNYVTFIFVRIPVFFMDLGWDVFFSSRVTFRFWSFELDFQNNAEASKNFHSIATCS